MPEPDSAPSSVTVIVVTWQGAHLLTACLDSLAAQTLRAAVLVVDNASTDATERVLAERRPPVRVLRLGTNTGFAGGVQAGLAQVSTPFVALLNNDAAADPEWLAQSMAALRARPDAAAVTARMRLWDDGPHGPVINNAGVALTAAGYGYDRGGDEPDGTAFEAGGEVFGFSGGAAVLRTAAVREVGGMPARYFLYYEDVDLSWRLRLAGHTVLYEPGAIVRHRHAATTDRRSDSFAYYNERNRLLTLVRCAPLSFAGAQFARFLATTASLQLRRALGQRVRDTPVFDLRVRLRAAGGFLRLLPWALWQRRRIVVKIGNDRRGIAHAWVGKAGPLSWPLSQSEPGERPARWFRRRDLDR